MNHTRAPRIAVGCAIALLISLLAFSLSFRFNPPVHAFSMTLQLPWPAGITKDPGIGAGQCTYNCNPGHVGRDVYAVDFNVVNAPVGAVLGGTAHKTTSTYLCTIDSPTNYIIWINHGNGLVSYYAHLEFNSWNAFADGTSVTQGQNLATSGSSCAPGGPHLHVAMHINSSGNTPWDGDPYAPEPMAAPYSGIYDGFSNYGLNTGVASGPMTSTALPPGRLDVFASGGAGSLYTKTLNAGSCWQNCWGLLGNPPGYTLASQPAATWWVHNTNVRIEAFAKAMDGNMWELWCEASVPGCWTWQNLGAYPPGSADTPNPAVAANTNGNRLDLFVSGGNQLWWKFYTGSPTGTCCWIGLDSPPGIGGPAGIRSGPSAMWYQNDYWLQVFVQGADNRLWSKACFLSCYSASDWGPWTYETDYPSVGPNPAPPNVTRSSSATDVWVKGANNNLYKASYNGSTWAWYQIVPPVPLASDPTSAWWNSKNWDDIFFGGSDNHVYHYYYRAVSGWRWSDLGLWPTGASSPGRMSGVASQG